MATITEDYVSFETAKLLKEKEFDEPCHAYYKDDGTFRESYSAHAIRNITSPCSFGVSAPTLQMTMKWLREVHNIHIDICSIWDNTHWLYQVFVITPRTARNSYVDKILYTSYEQAVEAGIKYSLKNLI